MCGIAGIISQRGMALDPEALIRMRDSMAHRGPDDCGGVFLSPSASGHYGIPSEFRLASDLHDMAAGMAPYTVGLAHRRLAIIDLSAAGHQPMCDLETGNWITFNGEIYNYQALREELSACGHMFKSQSDTEVILKGYAQWGLDCVRRLRGIFAFAVYDHRKSEQTRQPYVLTARDQLGVKPFYYYAQDGIVAFASEVRALLASGIVPRQLDPCGIRSYLEYGSVQEPFTLVQGIHSLPPGHTMVLEADRQVLTRYWQLPSPCAAPVSGAEMLQLIRDHLESAVQGQLISEVPLGAFLSGGIDSTAIVGLMRASRDAQVNTFSIVFDEPAYDERRYAQIAARHLSTKHSELLLQGDDVRRGLPQAIAAYDQPSIDGLNTYFVSKAVHEAGLTVALSGVGGDELFGGYGEYRKALLAERWGRHMQRLPWPLRTGLAGALHGFATRESGRKALDLLSTKYSPYFTTRRMFGQHQLSQMLSADLCRRSEGWQDTSFLPFDIETAGYDGINRISALELRTYMLSTLLRDTDQMSMAHGLEVRVPLLDHLLVELIFQLPGACKLESGQPKPLLTRSLGDLLPDACVHRPKQGFTLPFADWFKTSLRDEMRGTLEGHMENGLGFLDPSAVQDIWQQFEVGRVSWSRVWGLFILSKWVKAQQMTL